MMGEVSKGAKKKTSIDLLVFNYSMPGPVQCFRSFSLFSLKNVIYKFSSLNIFSPVMRRVLSVGRSPLAVLFVQGAL
jgi:hypothetical protein